MALGNSHPLKENKKAVVNLATFSLIILLLLVILGVSYFFYSESIEKADERVKKIELLNSLNSFRGELVDLVTQESANMTYSSSLDPQSITIYLENTTIRGNQDIGFKIIEVNISSLGIRFCSNYNFNPSYSSSYSFNGVCVSQIS